MTGTFDLGDVVFIKSKTMDSAVRDSQRIPRFAGNGVSEQDLRERM